MQLAKGRRFQGNKGPLLPQQRIGQGLGGRWRHEHACRLSGGLVARLLGIDRFEPIGNPILDGVGAVAEGAGQLRILAGFDDHVLHGLPEKTNPAGGLACLDDRLFDRLHQGHGIDLAVGAIFAVAKQGLPIGPRVSGTLTNQDFPNLFLVCI